MRPYAICSPRHCLIPSTGSSLRAPARPTAMSLHLIPNVAGCDGVFAGRHSSSSSPLLLSPRPPRGTSQVVRARKGLSRSRRLDKRNKNGGVATASEAAAQEKLVGEGSIDYPQGVEGFELSTTPMPVLPGEENDFWEGPQWNAFGFFVQYMWAFGIVFALIACGIAVATYNEGATDFRQTPIYKESIQSRELLEEPEASNSDVFEGNPTEVAPSLE